MNPIVRIILIIAGLMASISGIYMFKRDYKDVPNISRYKKLKGGLVFMVMFITIGLILDFFL